jgi:hypothetical protein
MEKTFRSTSQSSTKSGFSITGALVALSITAVGSAAVVSMIDNHTRGAQFVESKAEIASLMGSLGTLLADQQQCTRGLEFELPSNEASGADRAEHWFASLGDGRVGRKLTKISAIGVQLVSPGQRFGSARVNAVQILTDAQARTQISVEQGADTAAWKMVGTLEIELVRDSGALAQGQIKRHLVINLVVGQQSGRILACGSAPLQIEQSGGGLGTELSGGLGTWREVTDYAADFDRSCEYRFQINLAGHSGYGLTDLNITYAVNGVSTKELIYISHSGAVSYVRGIPAEQKWMYYTNHTAWTTLPVSKVERRCQ